MGDHRMSIKIEAKFHGVERKMDSYCNFYPASGYPSIHHAVIEFFEQLYDDGMDVYNEQFRAYEHQAREREQEEQDRRDFIRLQAKYKDNNAIS